MGYDTGDVSPPQIGLPLSLERLQRASADEERDAAWTEFIATYSETVLRACRAIAHDPDTAMDGYAYVLETLRADGCRRLRRFTPDGRSQFTTWLMVVVRRIMLDYLRHRYGRSRSAAEESKAEHRTRRRLEDLVGESIDPDDLPGDTAHPDAAVRRAELTHVLESVLESLDPRDRLLLVMRFTDGRGVKEIAAVMGYPSVFHVYRRLGAVLAGVRAALARRGVQSSDP